MFHNPQVVPEKMKFETEHQRTSRNEESKSEIEGILREDWAGTNTTQFLLTDWRSSSSTSFDKTAVLEGKT